MSRSGGIRWSGDGDMSAYSQRLRYEQEKLVKHIAATLGEVARKGSEGTKRRLRESATRTNSSGRYETGALQRTVSHDVRIVGNKVTARFGWVSSGVPYTVMQDEGTRGNRGQRVNTMNPPSDGIPGAFALSDSFIEAREVLRDKGLM